VKPSEVERVRRVLVGKTQYGGTDTADPLPIHSAAGRDPVQVPR
jgi:hypothetical protein